MLHDSARWEGFAFRDGDIVISTPPKCGTTWMQMIIALLVLQSPDFDRPLALISPWLDMLTRDLATVVSDLDVQRHRRFIKTHTPLDGLPEDERVSYVCVGRDPRDVGISWISQGRPVNPDPVLERFWLWVDDTAPPTDHIASLRGTLHHLSTFWGVRDRPNVFLLRYEDLNADLELEMRAIAARLNFTVPDGDWKALVEAATFQQMRARADHLAPNSTKVYWRDNRGFFRCGRSGQWRTSLDANDVVRYQARVEQLAAPDLAAWVHGSGETRWSRRPW